MIFVIKIEMVRCWDFLKFDINTFIYFIERQPVRKNYEKQLLSKFNNTGNVSAKKRSGQPLYSEDI